MVDGDGLVDLDHHGVVHSDDADEVSVAVGQVDCVDLKSFRLSVERHVDDQVALDQLSGDVGLLGMVQI